MKNKLKSIILISAFIIHACTSKVGEENHSVNTADSTGIAEKNFGSGFDEREFKVLSLPLHIDSNFINKCDTNKRLNFYQIRSLKGLVKEYNNSPILQHHINEFCRIDSLKENEAYEDYIKNLDIGMTKNSIAFKIGQIHMSESLHLFIWGISYDSYEACPYFSGTNIIGTYMDEAKQNHHILIGGEMSAGDPPATMEIKIYSILKQNKEIEITQFEIQDDLDLDGKLRLQNRYVVKVNKGQPEYQVLSTDTLSKEVNSPR